jgi:hypothetical protein
MTNDEHATPHLRYLDVDRLEAPLVEPLEVQAQNGDRLGVFNGVVVDPARRCVRYLVVDQGRVFHERRLIPLGPTHVDAEHHALRLVDETDPSEWKKFDALTYPPFSDEDLITAVFAR